MHDSRKRIAERSGAAQHLLAMTRGNQRDTDRARAQARANAGAANSTLKTADSMAQKMREKQEAADARKAQEKEEALKNGMDATTKKKVEPDKAQQDAKADALQLAKERAEAAWLKEQEEERERAQERRAQKAKEKAEAEAVAAEAAKSAALAKAEADASIPAQAKAEAEAKVEAARVQDGSVTQEESVQISSGGAAEDEGGSSDDNDGPWQFGSGGEKVLSKMLKENHERECLMEIEISRSKVAKLGTAVLAVSVSELKSLAEGVIVFVQKFNDGGAMLVAKGTPAQLEIVLVASKRLLSSFAEPVNEGGEEGEDEECPYIIPLPPREAAHMHSYVLAVIPCRFDVLLYKKYTSDGWLTIDLRGPDDQMRAAHEYLQSIISKKEAEEESAERALITAAIEMDKSAKSTDEDSSREEDTEDGESIVSQLTLDSSQVGKVIGRQGSVIKQIRVKSGANISLDKLEDGSGRVELRGASDAVRAAKREIERIMAR